MPTAVKVSVIVPVYKVEDYVRRCLDSLCNQTLKEIEIICINDGSPDRSIDILREYEARYTRMTVIDFPQNQGVAAARNAGLNVAVGEFIGFVDPDDAVDLNFYETLYNKAQSAGADIAKGTRKRIKHDGSEAVDTINEMIRHSKAYFSATFCTAIYRRSMIRKNQIRFPTDIHIGEDLVFQTRCILESKKFVTSDFVFYWHFLRKDSAAADFYVGQFGEDRKIDELRLVFDLIFEYTNEAFDTGKIVPVDYDILYYNNFCFSVLVILWTDDVHEKYACSELLIKFYRQCKRQAQLDQKLQEEQGSFYTLVKEGNLQKLTRYFVENYTLEDIVRANDIRSTAYFQR